MPVLSESLFQPRPPEPAAEESADAVLAQVREYRAAHAAEIVRELAELVAVPNDVRDEGQLEANARVIREMLERRGMTTELLRTAGGRPAVFGELRVPGAAATLLLYGHYDGVPAEREGWHSDPYLPVLRAGPPAVGGWETIPLPEAGPMDGAWRLYGRSVADSKNAIVAIIAALDALAGAGAPPRVNLKLLLDGEEEQESPGLPELVATHAEKLRADLLISASGEVHQSGLPTVAYGVRGALVFDATVHTAAEALHSGHFGGFAPNAAMRMAELLTSLKGPDGRVRVEGFHDDALPLSTAEREAVQAVPRVEGDVRRRFAIAEPEAPGRLLQELINEPTLNVRGVQAGFTGEAARNIVPHEARASFDARLVKGMDPERTMRRITDHLQREGWRVLDRDPSTDEIRTHPRLVVLRTRGGFPAARTPLDTPVARTFLAAVRRAAGAGLVVEPTEGGSLALHLFERLGIPVVTLPTSNYDCNQHTADENLELRRLFEGVDTFASLFLWA
jgi:acetylornithine deacetylase/succinyl-diaminopimelate desuccinylase-like protein